MESTLIGHRRVGIPARGRKKPGGQVSLKTEALLESRAWLLKRELPGLPTPLTRALLARGTNTAGVVRKGVKARLSFFPFSQSACPRPPFRKR